MSTPTSSTVTPLLKGTLSPHKIRLQQLPQLWREFTPQEKAEVQTTKALMFEGYLENDKTLTSVAAIEFFSICGGVKAYKADNVAGAILANGLGKCFHHGKLVTDAAQVAPENPQVGVGTGQGRSLSSGGVRQPTAHLWKVRFVLPEKPSDIASLSDYQTLAAAITADHDQIAKGIEEAKQLAALALAQCEQGKNLLEKIGAGWAKVAALTDKKAALEKAISGLEALNSDNEFDKPIAKRRKELTGILADIDKATLEAQQASAPTPVVSKP